MSLPVSKMAVIVRWLYATVIRVQLFFSETGRVSGDGPGRLFEAYVRDAVPGEKFGQSLIKCPISPQRKHRGGSRMFPAASPAYITDGGLAVLHFISATFFQVSCSFFFISAPVFLISSIIFFAFAIFFQASSFLFNTDG